MSAPKNKVPNGQNNEKIKKVTPNTSKKNIEVKSLQNSLSYVFSKREDLDFSTFKPKIAVIGVGGGGGNAINAAIDSAISDILTITYNTDAQVLKYAKSDIVMQLGPKCTKGHGAGADPLIGKKAVLESEAEIKKHLQGVHVAFIVAGMGGGTGTGAGPEIARIAVELGILTIGLVTTPFEFEGEKRMEIAKKGVIHLQEKVDILIVISNQNLFSLSTEETTFLNAFELTDNVLCSGLRSFIHTIKEPSRINVDIADFFTVMKGKHCRSRMGTGIAEGENRGETAAQLAMSSPLLDLEGMNTNAIDAVIICIRCGKDTTLTEINKAVAFIRKTVHKDANIIFGASIDDSMQNKLEVSLFATLNQKLIEQKPLKKSQQIIEEENVISFNEILPNNISEDEYIGTPHSFAINEPINCYTQEHKSGIISRVFEFLSNKCDSFLNIFSRNSEDDDSKTPPYMQ